MNTGRLHSCAAVFLALLAVSPPISALAADSGWADPVVLDKGVHAGRVACLHDQVHAVWIKAGKLYWSRAQEGGTWSQPTAVSVTVEGLWADLISDGVGLHLVWPQSFNMGYKYFDGHSWSPEESILPTRQSLGPGAMAVAGGGPHVFFYRWEFGMIPHTPGSRPMMMVTRKEGGWTSPTPVPGADNVVQMDAAAGPDGFIQLAWIHDELSYLGRNFGLGSRKSPRSIRAAIFNPADKSWTRPVKIAGLDRGVNREVRIAAGPNREAYVFWMNGYQTRRFGWSRRKNGRWSLPFWIETDPSDRRTLSGDITADRHCRVIIVASARHRVPQPRVIIDAGTEREHTFVSQQKMSMGTDVQAVVSVSGTVHFVSTLSTMHYFCFTPVP